MTPDSPHVSARELASHAARCLAAADILRVSDHLAGCAVCREAFNQARTSRDRCEEILADVQETVWPTFAELDGAPADSPVAREALADLAAFRDELARLPVKFHGPTPTTGTRTDPDADDRVIVPAPWRWRTTSAWAAGLAALFVALTVWWGAFARPGPEGSALLRDDRGRLVDLGGLPPDLKKSVETSLRSGRLPPPPVSELITQPGETAGDTVESAMTATAPVGTVVRETRPTLSWTAHPDATGYRVSVVPVAGGTVVSSPLLPATQTRWTPPDPLPRGVIYSWQVAAARDGKTIDRAPRPPAGEARFEVLDAGLDGELSRTELRAAGNPLVLGTAYWRAGLIDAARDQFHRLAGAHAQSGIAQQLEQAASRGKGAD